MGKNTILKWTIIAGLFLIIVLMLRDYIGAIIFTFVLAYVLKPLYNLLYPKIGKRISALLCLLIFLVIIFLPITFIIAQIIQELSKISLASISDKISQIPYVEQITNSNTGITNNLISTLTFGITSIPTLILKFFIILFGAYHLLLDWDNSIRKISEFIPIKNRKGFFNEMGRTTKGITYGLSFVALYDFLISLLGFSIAGVDFPILFALLVGILAFTYLLDPFIVWVPLSAYYFYTGNTYTAIGVLITGLIILTDAFIRPKILGKFAKINPFIMLLGLVGGLALFGVIGLVLGPILLIAGINIPKYI